MSGSFFHPPALSPFLRPVCFSSLSDLPSCPAGSFPPCSPPAAPCATEAAAASTTRGRRCPSPASLGLEPFHLLLWRHKSAFSGSCLKNWNKHLLNLQKSASPFHPAGFQREEALLCSESLTRGLYEKLRVALLRGCFLPLFFLFFHLVPPKKER